MTEPDRTDDARSLSSLMSGNALPMGTDRPVPSTERTAMSGFVPFGWAVVTAVCLGGAVGVQRATRVFLFDERSAMLGLLAFIGAVGAFVQFVRWMRRPRPADLTGPGRLMLAIACVGGLTPIVVVGAKTGEYFSYSDVRSFEKTAELQGLPGWKVTSTSRSRRTSGFTSATGASVSRSWSAPDRFAVVRDQFLQHYPRYSATSTYQLHWARRGEVERWVSVSPHYAPKTSSVVMSVGHDGTAFPQAVAERLTSPSPGWRRQGRWSWKPSRRKGWGTYPLVTYRVSMEPDAVVVALTARFGKPADAVGQAIIYRPDLANSPQSRTPGERTTAIGMGGSVANGPTGVTVSVSE